MLCFDILLANWSQEKNVSQGKVRENENLEKMATLFYNDSTQSKITYKYSRLWFISIFGLHFVCCFENI